MEVPGVAPEGANPRKVLGLAIVTEEQESPPGRARRDLRPAQGPARDRYGGEECRLQPGDPPARFRLPVEPVQEQLAERPPEGPRARSMKLADRSSYRRAGAPASAGLRNASSTSRRTTSPG